MSLPKLLFFFFNIFLNYYYYFQIELLRILKKSKNAVRRRAESSLVVRWRKYLFWQSNSQPICKKKSLNEKSFTQISLLSCNPQTQAASDHLKDKTAPLTMFNSTKFYSYMEILVKLKEAEARHVQVLPVLNYSSPPLPPFSYFLMLNPILCCHKRELMFTKLV